MSSKTIGYNSIIFIYNNLTDRKLFFSILQRFKTRLKITLTNYKLITINKMLIDL